MSNSDNVKIIVNRIVSFLAGALVMFAVMNITVVEQAKKKNVALAAELDASKYEAGRLLDQAKALLEANNYEQATASLTDLFDKHPGSAESVEGKALLALVEDSKEEADAKWSAAMPEVKQTWEADRMETLRAESETARIQMEKELSEKVAKEWEYSKENIRREWEAESLL